MALKLYAPKPDYVEKSITGYVESGRTSNTLGNARVPLKFSASCGIQGDDLRDIFTEIGDDWGKLRIYDKDNNRLRVEVKQWSAINNLAWLWIRIPSYSGITDTKFTIKYHFYNSIDTTYIGQAGSAAAANVWTGYVGVWHMHKIGGEYKDSSGNGNHGTMIGAAPDINSAYGGQCVDFNSASRVDCGSDPSLDLLSHYTIELAYEFVDPTATKIVASRWGSPYTNGFRLGMEVSGSYPLPRFRHEANNVQNIVNGFSIGPKNKAVLCQQAKFIVGSGSSTNTTYNGTSVSTDANPTTKIAIQSFNSPFLIGATNPGNYFDAKVYEVRLRAVNASGNTNWVKVMYYGLRDNLVYYVT